MKGICLIISCMFVYIWFNVGLFYYFNKMMVILEFRYIRFIVVLGIFILSILIIFYMLRCNFGFILDYFLYFKNFVFIDIDFMDKDCIN